MTKAVPSKVERFDQQSIFKAPRQPGPIDIATDVQTKNIRRPTHKARLPIIYDPTIVCKKVLKRSEEVVPEASP